MRPPVFLQMRHFGDGQQPLPRPQVKCILGQPSLRAVIAAGRCKERRSESHAFKQAMSKRRFRMSDTIELPFRCYRLPGPATIERQSQLFGIVMRICQGGFAYRRLDTKFAELLHQRGVECGETFLFVTECRWVKVG